ncbi:MAG: hypothetical protein LBV43_12020 [Prevotella sp.]|jgi:hypothetical protein|nr:hypothetical protein [Prevotella sp.]
MRLLLCLFISSILLFTACNNKNKVNPENQSGENMALADTIPLNIDSELAGKIKPVIGKWLEYYHLDINEFSLSDKKKLNLEQLKNDTTYPYYGKFEKKDDVYIPALHDYSPDKKKYINLLAASNVSLESDGKYHYTGSDDNQQLGLFNLEEKSYVMFSFRGINEFVDAVFWIDNDTFVLVGYNTLEAPGYYYLEMYDLKKDSCEKYILRKEYDKEESYGIADMKAREIIVE